jgi:hypothetical protein
LSGSRDSSLELCQLGEVSDIPCSDGARPSEGGWIVDTDWWHDRSLDPLEFLTGNSIGLTFTHSVNRGRFSRKSRWVSLAG